MDKCECRWAFLHCADRRHQYDLARACLSHRRRSVANRLPVHCNNDDLFAAILRYKQHRSWVSVEHASFSAAGAWFVRWSDGNVQIGSSAQEVFPDSFTALAAPYLQLSGPAAQAPQYCEINNVFFGANDAVIIKLGGSRLVWDRLSESLEAGLTSIVGPGEITLGVATTLCFYNPELYFMELVSKWSFNTNKVWAWVVDSPLSEELLTEITQGNRPAAHLIPKPSSGAATPPVSKSNPTATVAALPAEASPITAEFRKQIDNIFQEHNGEKGYLTALEAATAFQELAHTLNLARSDLARIWDETDADKDGRFDRDEFTQAVIQMTITAGVEDLSSTLAPKVEDMEPRWCDQSITCNGCHSSIGMGTRSGTAQSARRGFRSVRGLP